MQIKNKSLEWLQNGEKMLTARLKNVINEEEREMLDILLQIVKQLASK